MDLSEYVAGLRYQVAAAAEAAGDDVSEVADRLMAPLDSAIRLTFLEVLAAAAAEITRELAPSAVELRLRGREPEFVVMSPPAESPAELDSRGVPAGADTTEGQPSRINLRLPDSLKARVEEAAEREGLSINAWLVRAVSAAVERGADMSPPRERRNWKSGQRYTGWAR